MSDRSPWQPPSPQPTVEESEKISWGVYALQFFLIPLLLVALCVGLFYFLRWLTYEPRHVKSYLETLQQSSGSQQAQSAQNLFNYIQQSKRWQGFYDLTTTLSSRFNVSNAADENARLTQLAEKQRQFCAEFPNFTSTVTTSFESLRSQKPRSDDSRLTLRYLAQMMALVGDPASVPTLLAAIEDEDSAVVTHSLIALACIEDPATIPPLIRVSREHSDPVNRRMATLALTFFKTGDAQTALKNALQDGDAMVRLQAALGLAYHQMPEGKEILVAALDRAYLEKLSDAPDINGRKPALTGEQQSQIRAEAIEALGRLGLTREDSVTKILQSLSTNKTEPIRVRDAALKTLSQKK